MATRYRVFVVDMADRKIEDFRHELGQLYGLRVLTLDPITITKEAKPPTGKRPKSRIGTGDKLGEVPHTPVGTTVTGEPRRSIMLCAACQAGTCAKCFYPLDCPCASPMHNGAPFEALQVEAITV